MEIEPSTNFYASNLELDFIPPLFLHQLGRSRWDIDARLFQTLVTEGALKQPSLHQCYKRAPVVLTMIRVLAFTLAQVFYHRQVRSRFRQASFGFRDLARRMAFCRSLPRIRIDRSASELATVDSLQLSAFRLTGGRHDDRL